MEAGGGVEGLGVDSFEGGVIGVDVVVVDDVKLVSFEPELKPSEALLSSLKMRARASTGVAAVMRRWRPTAGDGGADANRLVSNLRLLSMVNDPRRFSQIHD